MMWRQRHQFDPEAMNRLGPREWRDGGEGSSWFCFARNTCRTCSERYRVQVWLSGDCVEIQADGRAVVMVEYLPWIERALVRGFERRQTLSWCYPDPRVRRWMRMLERAHERWTDRWREIVCWCGAWRRYRNEEEAAS